jgi:hypothetical protein
VGVALADLEDRLEAVHVRHGEVEQDSGGTRRRDSVHRAATVAGLAHDAEARILLHAELDQLSQLRDVVDQKH